MKSWSLPFAVGLVAGLQVGCSNSESQAHRSAGATSDEHVVLAVSAGVNDEKVQAAETEQKEVKGDGSLQDIVSEKTQVQSPIQSPTQSPTQSPFQSPTQSPLEIPGVTIKAISYTGSGCPADSVALNIAPDAKAFTLLFDSFYIEAEPSTKSNTSIASTFCDVALTLLAPAGWQVALLSVDYRGFADLAEGDTAVILSSMRFTGSSTTTAFTSRIDGALSDNFQTRDEILLKTAQWSDCNGVEKVLNVGISATVRATTDMVASVSLDSADGELSYKSGLVWRRCY